MVVNWGHLVRRGHHVGRKRVARFMRQHHLVGSIPARIGTEDFLTSPPLPAGSTASSTLTGPTRAFPTGQPHRPLEFAAEFMP